MQRSGRACWNCIVESMSDETRENGIHSFRRARAVMVAAGLSLTLVACGTTPTSTSAVRQGTAPGSSPAGGSQQQSMPKEDTDLTGDGSIEHNQSLTPFDADHIALRKLDPALLRAVRQAATDAREDGIEFFVTSGWRSRAYQQRLLDEGIERYGSLEEARKFVNTPDKSTHVSGKGIDIGPTDADDWLIRHGSKYGLCQTYANEMWHFELMTTPGGECPAPLADATDAH